MKDFVNPVLLLVVIVLMVWHVVAESDAAADALEVSLLTICVTGVVVDGSLGLARALSRRPAVRSVVWAGVFCVFGCFGWVLCSEGSARHTAGEERQAYRELYRTQLANPLARDAEGENLLTRAAALGEVDVVRRIMSDAQLTEADIDEAGLRAAESNKTAVLDELARRGLSAKAVVQGTPLLHAAAQNAACEAMAWLLARGATPNSRDAEGATPLIHATIAESVPAVQLLLDYGADVRLKDSTGQSPADFARSEELQNLLSEKK